MTHAGIPGTQETEAGESPLWGQLGLKKPCKQTIEKQITCGVGKITRERNAKAILLLNRDYNIELMHHCSQMWFRIYVSINSYSSWTKVFGVFCLVLVEVVGFILIICLFDWHDCSTTAMILMSLKVHRNVIKTCFYVGRLYSLHMDMYLCWHSF